MKEKMSLSSEVSAQAARKKVSIGQSYGWIEIPKDFSSSLSKRFLGLLDYDNFSISNGGSNIRVHLDHGNSLVAQEVRASIVRAVQATVQKLLNICDLTELAESFSGGIVFGPLLYPEESAQLTYGQSILPGLIVVVQNLMASALTADQLISEREGGLLIRLMSSAIPTWACILSQVLAHLLIIVAQVWL
jgi:hypothetical protein